MMLNLLVERRVVFAVAVVFFCASMLAYGQGIPIENQGALCPGYGPPPSTTSDQYCYSFQAVAGEVVKATCSATDPLTGQSLGCAVRIGPENGTAFDVSGSYVIDDTIPQTGSWILETSFARPQGFFSNESFTLVRLSLPTCISDAHSLCLAGYRFRVEATFQQTPDGPSAPASAVSLTSDTGYFWFFDPTNIELVVKVLSGCSVDSEYWVFAGGLTNVGVELKVTDTLTGAVKMYPNAIGTPFQPIQDTSAFPCP